MRAVAPLPHHGQPRGFHQGAHLARVQSDALIGVGLISSAASNAAVDLEVEDPSWPEHPRCLARVCGDRGALRDVLKDDVREDEIPALVRDARQRSISRLEAHVPHSLASPPRLRDHSRRDVDADHVRDSLREGSHQPADSAPDLQRFGCAAEIHVREDQGKELFLARPPEAPRVRGPACDEEARVTLRALIPVLSHSFRCGHGGAAHRSILREDGLHVRPSS